MLSIGAMGKGQANYYVDLATEDYYLKGGEPPGRWIGQGAEALRLTESKGQRGINGEEFLQLFKGLDAKGKPLVQNAASKERKPGWDLTFSAPKSVSTVWAVADEKTRRAIQEAHFAAVKEAISYIEAGATTRRGKGGGIKEKAKLIVGTFEHGTSRAQDPQLHTHALILNIAVRADGTTGALESQHFYRSKMAAGALYRAELASRLSKLGYSIDREKTTFEIRGVPSELMEEFSKRRAEIEVQLDKEGRSGAKAAAAATLSTRQVKEHRARGELFEEWKQTAFAYGFTGEEAEKLRSQRAQPQDPEHDSSPHQNGHAPNKKNVVIVDSLCTRAIEQITKDKSHFSERDLLRATSEAAPGWGVSAADLRAGVKRNLENNSSVMALGEHKGEQRYTTREVWELENALLKTAGTMQDSKAHRVSHEATLYGILRAEQRANQKARAKDPDAANIQMSEEQKRALSHITEQPGSIAIVSGMAGTGKTFMLDAARESWEKQGYKVIGGAVAGKAARGLEEGSGIKSSTLSRLFFELKRGFEFEPEVSTWQKVKTEALYATWQISAKTRLKMLGQYHKPSSKVAHLWKQATGQISKKHREYLDRQLERRERFEITNKTVVVVDEAGMIGTKQMAALIAEVEARGGKLVLVGDSRQLQSVEVGGPFRALENRLGRSELTGIIRQKDAWQREAVTNFADGNAEKALRAFQERGFLNVREDRSGAKKALIQSWQKDGLKAPEKNVIFAGTRAEARDLNRMAQEERKKAKRLGFLRVKINGETFYERDRVLFTENKQALGVQNGTTGTIKDIDHIRGTLSVKLDNGDMVHVPYRKYQSLSLGYALTTHKGQGMTVKNSYVLCGGTMADRELSYVQASRATDKTEFFTNRVSRWNPDRQRREDATLSELARQMSQSRQKDLAHDVAFEAAREAARKAAQRHEQMQEKMRENSTQGSPQETARYHTR